MQFDAVVVVAWDFIKKIYNAGGAVHRWVIWFWMAFIFLYVLLGIYEKKNSDVPKSRKPKKKNYYYTMHIFLGLYVIFQYGNLLFGYPSCVNMVSAQNVIDIQNVLGFVLLAGGFIFVIEGRLDLNGYWACDICIYTDITSKKLVRSGIYKRIRHPIYFGQSIMAIGTGLVSNNWIILCFAFCFLGANFWRAFREDQFLKAEFPEEWPEYRDSSSFFIPFF